MASTADKLAVPVASRLIKSAGLRTRTVGAVEAGVTPRVTSIGSLAAVVVAKVDVGRTESTEAAVFIDHASMLRKPTNTAVGWPE